MISTIPACDDQQSSYDDGHRNNDQMSAQHDANAVKDQAAELVEELEAENANLKLYIK